MKVVNYLTAVLVTIGTCLSRPAAGDSFQHILATPKTTFRDIKATDIPDLTRLVIAAFSPGLMYHYLAPNLDANYESFWLCMNASLTKAWGSRDTNTTLGKVITVRDKPVSFAIWNLRTKHDEQFRTSNHWGTPFIQKCNPLPGVNVTRAMDFDQQYDEIDPRYFDNAHPRQVYLNLLATHPQWEGHGFGARHIQWGKELSLRITNDVWPLTLLATPAGWPLYDALGFESIANATIRMLDGMGELWFEVMRWQAKVTPL